MFEQAFKKYSHILDCPGGTFIGAGVKTVVLFFEKGTKTRKVWFYQLAPSTSSGQARNLGKTNPLNDAESAEVLQTIRGLL